MKLIGEYGDLVFYPNSELPVMSVDYEMMVSSIQNEPLLGTKVTNILNIQSFRLRYSEGHLSRVKTILETLDQELDRYQ